MKSSVLGRWPSPWVFSLLILPLGMVYGFNFTALPFLLAKAGVPVDRIASVSAISSLPGVLAVLIAPIVDIKLRRRTWLAIGAFGTAIAACIYVPLIGPSHLVPPESRGISVGRCLSGHARRGRGGASVPLS